MVSLIKNILRQRWKHSIASFRKDAETVLNMMEGEVAIATYTSSVDKMKIFSAYIHDGIECGDWIFCLYPDEECKIVKAKLN